MSAESIRMALRLFRSESRAETVAALVLVGIAVWPVVKSHYSDTGNDAVR